MLERWQVNFEFVGFCVKHGLRSRKGLAGPHGKTGKRADITDLVLAIGIETGRGRGDQAPAFLHPRLCFTLLTSLGLRSSTPQSHKATRGWRLQDG